MSAALAALLLLGSATEEESYAALVRLFETRAPEPEPPPGVLAPADSERHRRAAAAYEEALARWRESEGERRRRLDEACTAHLAAYPEGERRGQVLYLRGATRFEGRRYAEARADLETYLAAGAGGREAAPARAALVAACRALGDYRAALRHGGPDPDLLEEAGEVERAIAAALAAGEDAKAERWRLLGKPFPGRVEIPAGAPAAVVEAGRELPPELREALRTRFSPKKVAFLSATSSYPAVYLLDRSGMVRAVDARPDSLEHRIRNLAEAQ